MKVSRVCAVALLVLSWRPVSGEPDDASTYHLIKIVEVFPGTAAQPYSQYVELQAYAAGQNLTAGHKLFFFNAAGAKVDSVTLTNVTISANQMRILIMTPQAATLFGTTRDFTMSIAINPAGGKVCWDASDLDCFAWGNYSGTPTGVGPAFRAQFGLPLGKSALRRLDLAGFPAALDAGDDRDSCGIDFVLGLPSPVNNFGQSGSLPQSTCGNGVLEGLEQCDDDNTISGDGCNSACADEFCGDGVVQPGETCDDGNLTNGDGCDATCDAEPICGNGVVEAPETCDDGNTISGDGCDGTCHLEAVCGNGILEANEQCDDGNLVPGDGCSALCRSEASCRVTKTGDVNVNGTITSSDIIALVNFVFKGGLAPLPCRASGDVNCSGMVTSSDIIYLVNYVFKGGALPCNVCALVPGTWSCP